MVWLAIMIHSQWYMRGVFGLTCVASVIGMVQRFHYDKEPSRIFELETFGFLPGGHMELAFDHFNIHSPSVDNYKVGFVMHLTESETTARSDIEEARERLERDPDDCWLDRPGEKDKVIDLSDKDSWAMKVSS